jgi:hypothetical protein
MSLAETQALMNTIKELMALLQNMEVKTTKIVEDTPKVKDAIVKRRELLRLLGELNQLLAIMGLPKELKASIGILQDLALAAYATYTALKLVQNGTLVGQIVGIIGIGLTVYSASNSIGSTIEGY